MASPLSLATLAVVLCSCLAADYGWQPQKELTFAVQGQDVVGLPQLKPQYAGFRYNGEIHVQTHSPRVLLLKFFNMTYTKIHEDLQQGWWKGPETRNKTRLLPLTSSTIVVKMTRSVSPELIVHSGLDDWQINFIKGLVSHLMVYLNDNSPSEHNKIFNTEDKDIYSVFEDSVSGRCEVLYELNPLPKQVAPNNHRMCDSEWPLWEITKTRNFSNCQTLSEDHAHLPTSDCPPGGSNCGQFWTRASLTQIVGCGEMNNLLFLSSVSSSTKNAQLHLKNNSQAVVNSNVNITLISVLDLKSRFNPPQDKQSMQSLLYSYSPVLKESIFRQCQDPLAKSEEEEESREHIDTSMQINPTRGEKKNYDVEHGKSSFRNKRGLKYNYNRYKSDSNELQNNENSNEQSFKKMSPSRNSGKATNKKRIFEAKSDEELSESPEDKVNKFNSGEKSYRLPRKLNKKQHSEESNERSEEVNRFNSEERSYQRPRQPNKKQHSEESNEQYSEESKNQNSEEMDLEEHWKISGKDTNKVAPHQPFNLLSLAHRRTFDVSCLSSKLRQFVGEIAGDLKEINILPEKNTLDKFSMAVDICRTLSFDKLTAAAEDIFEIHNGAPNIMKNDERRVFRDVMIMCGSYPAFRVIKGWVLRQQVEGEEAAQMIASLPYHILSPNKYLIQDFFEMVQKIAEEEDQQPTTTAVLSLSNLVRSACVNQVSRQHQFSSILKPVCDEGFVERYMNWLSHKISSDAPLRRAYIGALGRVGSPHVIEILKNIATNANYSSYYRTSAVFEMRYQALKRNPKMAPLLMSLYHTYSMPASARIASVALMVYTEPGLAIWQRLAISTWYEPSSAVAQFVSSTIRNIARSKDSLYSHMSKAAALVQPLARPSKIHTNKPFNLVSSWLSSDLEELVLEQISWMQFHGYSDLYYRHTSRYFGFSRTNVEVGFSVSNPDELWTTLQDLIGVTNIYDTKPTNKGASRTLSHIEKTLNLDLRTMPSLQAAVHLKVNNMMERMILINRDTIKSLARGGQKLISEVTREGKPFSFQKTDMDSFHISTTTEMGFPVQFSVRTPWIVRTKGELNATYDGLVFAVAFMYSSQILSSMSVMSPWDNVQHMAGAYGTNFVQLPPIRMVSNIDTASDSIKAATAYIDQHRLLYFNMQPFTSQRKIKIFQPALLSPDTIPVKIGESVQVPISIGLGRFFNNVYSSERTEHFNVFDCLRQTRGVVGFPMVFANMESRSFETVMKPVHAATMNFSMVMASKSMGVLDSDSLKDSLISRILYSLDKVTSLGQSPFMSAFQFFDGLFGKREEPSTTTENPSTPRGDDSQSDKQDRTNNPSGDDKPNEDNNPTDENNPSGEKQNESSPDSDKNEKDNEKPSKSDNQPKRKLSNIQEQVYTTTYESAVGSFNASLVDPFTNLVPGSGVSHLMDHVLSKINSGSAVVYSLELKSLALDDPTTLSAYVAYASTYSRRVNRLGLFVKKDKTQTKMTAVHEDPADISANLKRRISEDLKHNLFLDYVHSTTNQDIRASVKASLGVSRSELVQLRSSPLLEACSQDDALVDFQCQQMREQAQQISFGNITMYYNNDAQFLEKMMVRYANAAKAMIQGTEEKSGEGSNTMTLMFDVDQKTQSVETFITTPATSVKIHELPLSTLPMSTMAEWATQPDAVPEYCGVSPQRFRTFDGGESLFEMGEGWHLVLHDRTRKYGISVLAQSSNNTMEIEINKNDEVVMRVKEGMKIYVNDKLQSLDKDHSVMVVTDRKGRVAMHTIYTPDDSLRIQLPNESLDLKYTASSLVVRAGSTLQGRLCGICGSYSNTGEEQYVTAHGHPARSAMDFAGSFHLRESSPQHSDSDN